MQLKFSVAVRIAKPVNEVFEAVVDPQQLSSYFTTGGAEGRLETGKTVTWDFRDFPGAFPVKVETVETNKRIVLHWGAQDDAAEGETFVPHDTTVTMTFEPLDDGRTLVRISEEGWRETAKGLAASYGNCEGWTGMLFALKVWVERGFNLREGSYK
jgi:uncharacterized protein YndB with AHSA1/START domain